MKRFATIPGLVLAVLLPASVAHAATFNVTTTSDLTGANPSCVSPCSLRQAIADANANGEGLPQDNIKVPASATAYTLSSGELPITAGNLTISGAGAASTVVDQATASSRVFHVSAAATVLVTISGLTITGGSVGGTTNAGGGGILNEGGGGLTVTGSIVQGNTVSRSDTNLNGGGGIFNVGAGPLTVTGSTVRMNTVQILVGAGSALGGGGIYQDGTGAVTISNTAVTGNTVTLSGGLPTGGGGGGILNNNGGSMSITDSSVTGNSGSITMTAVTAVSGLGGGGVQNADTGGPLTLTRSTVAGNSATVDTGMAVSPSDSGGGGVLAGTNGLTVDRSTVSGNTASLPGALDSGGGGIFYGGRTATLTNSTLSSNRLTFSGSSNGGGGGYFGALGNDTFLNVTVAGNQANSGGALFVLVPDNLQNTLVAANSAPSCSGKGFHSLGHNLESPGNTCGLGAAGDKPNIADPKLGGLASNGGTTQTRALLLGSPAIDAGASCPATDQRGISRPRGAACDIGAFEYVPDVTPPVTTIVTGPSGTTSDATPTFTFSSNEAGSSFQCDLDGGPFVACTSPLTLGRLSVGKHTFGVRAVDPSRNVGTPSILTFTVVLPSPVLGKQFNVQPVRGKVYVSLPRGATLSRFGAHASYTSPIKGRRFVPLTEARQIPVGSFLDARKGTARITSASTSRGKTFTGDFSGGVFQVLQSRRRSSRGLTELRLKGSSFRSCRSRRARGAEVGEVVAQAARSRRRIRRLRGRAHGRFRTRGRYSAATVRGTSWTVTDRCDGTLTTVSRGVVIVRDFRRHKNIRVRRGKHYLAKAP